MTNFKKMWEDLGGGVRRGVGADLAWRYADRGRTLWTMKRYCPACSQLVRMNPGGTTGDDDPHSLHYPWKFVEHDRDDERGGQIFKDYCPGSGQNDWGATNSIR